MSMGLDDVCAGQADFAIAKQMHRGTTGHRILSVHHTPVDTYKSTRSIRVRGTMRQRVLMILLLCSCTAFAADIRDKLLTAIAQLRAHASSQPQNDELWRDVQNDVTVMLTRAEASLQAGRLYLAVDELGRARVTFGAYEDARQQTPFDVAWKTDRPQLVSLDAAARNRDWSDVPAAVRALAETAQGQTMALVDASKAYAEVTSEKSGLYYLGEAKADEQFATYVYSLAFRRSGTLFAARAVSADIQKLQQQVTASFKPPLSIDRHSDFIRLNSMLKLARELDASGLHYGAAFQYLSAIQQFGVIKETPPTSGQQAHLRQALANEHERLSKTAHDDSLALMFVERAQERLTLHDNHPSDADWTAIAAIVEHVLPAYAELQTAAPKAPKQNPNEVVLTLVRWPYT